MEVFSKIAIAFTQGGAWMWVILVMQIAAIAIIVERYVTLYLKRKTTEMNFANEFESLIRKGELNEALAKARQSQANHPLAYAIEAGIHSALNLGGKEEIQGKMDEVLLAENSKLEQRTGFLPMLANVGTLTGLLGTIVGMIKSFAAVTYANPMEKATLLSAGISEAMNTTAYGLIMAIPTLVLFAVLANRATQLSEDLNQGALKVFNWLSFAYEPVPARVARTKNNPETPTVNA
ncbi:MAG: MotA/TolQ/ExbB proton channel family protein [Bdellovibrionales bacterium]|nr:MotA/TolQ/ExbB proton channel family protein [Bdellovibrionales bacterium]MCB0392707.1 MotA/TolQ/ExbB proton channel family protein [Bdellovibrionales bacterium]